MRSARQGVRFPFRNRDLPVMLVGVAAALALGMMPQAVEAQSYPEDILGYWKFEEGSGAVAHDSVGWNDGTITGAGWTEGQVGGALLLDGNDCVTVADDESLHVSGDLTIEGWVRFDVEGGNPQGYPWDASYLAAKNGAGPKWALAYWWSYRDTIGRQFLGRLVADGQASRMLSPTPELTPGDWYHLAITHRRDDVDVLYVNGIEVDRQWTQGPLVCADPPLDCNSPNTDLNFGCRTNDGVFMNFVIGAIDEIAIYTRALTPEEVATHYRNGLRGIGYELTPAFECRGFEAPMAKYPVAVRGPRVLPLKAALLDQEGEAVSEYDVASPPVVQVWWEAGTPETEDTTYEALAAGLGTEGNQFVFTGEGKWRYNLGTQSYTASGTYTVFMRSGDETEYRLEPVCVTEFLIR